MGTTRREVRVRRVYEEPDGADGVRVLVDRVWPRGMRKEQAGLDAWEKEAAPSAELRRWYGHRRERYPDFAERYRAELARPERRAAVDRLRERAGDGVLTLLTATRDVEYSHAVLLAEAVRGEE
ncbi:DUF488 domain-containing protein [Streptomyces sp. JJ36]|uniref:DUF488 domain-containing protein n=1 Tax=Streptomyces sp. JJ36 TaxID=2736645 RepID=UPI001F465D04|nr:DUF488 family protein [Streptomyces sp. JJ36]MCF6523164.1 DUF488 family protein [Streptomyces sp. JJ36]